jgi:hypothetical protein
MSEKKLILRSGPYTNFLAAEVGTKPQDFDPTGILSTDPREKKKHARAIIKPTQAYLDVVQEGEVSLASYDAKRVRDAKKYQGVIYARHTLFSDLLDSRRKNGLSVPSRKLFSVGYGPDGYVPEPAETVREASAFVAPQIGIAAHLGYHPVAEATTSVTRLRGALRAANDAGVDIDIGLAFDADGRLAADGATLDAVVDLVERNPDRIDSRVALGANCGSLAGIDSAASQHPGVLKFAYPNSVEAAHIRHLEAVGNGGCTHEHHNGEVSVREFADVALKHKFRSVSVCCGFGPLELAQLKAELIRSRKD